MTFAINSVAPDEREAKQAKLAMQQLKTVSKSLTLQTSDGCPLLVPASALMLLTSILSEMAQGRAVTLLASQADLTTQQAAQILQVSRPFLVKELDAGRIPHRVVGKHRRICYEDVLRYKHEHTKARREAMDFLVNEAQELGLGYD